MMFIKTFINYKIKSCLIIFIGEGKYIMTLNFNITDDLGNQFISALRWKYPDRTNLTDDRLIKKHLKRCMGYLIDEQRQNVALGTTEQTLNTLRQQSMDMMRNMEELERQYFEEKQALTSTFVPTDTGEETV